MLILDLCGGTGAWSQPYKDAGYCVDVVDLRDGRDVRLLQRVRAGVRGILAAPDCDRELHELFLEFPFIHREARCPACSWLVGIWRRYRAHEYDIEDVIIHLNDQHKWTRERIADWVATQEQGSERHEALTVGTSDVRGTTEMESPVLAKRA